MCVDVLLWRHDNTLEQRMLDMDIPGMMGRNLYALTLAVRIIVELKLDPVLALIKKDSERMVDYSTVLTNTAGGSMHVQAQAVDLRQNEDI